MIYIMRQLPSYDDCSALRVRGLQFNNKTQRRYKMSIKDFEECDCECHKNSNIRHADSCCFTCPHCKKSIKKFIYEKHKKTCANRDIADAFFM